MTIAITALTGLTLITAILLVAIFHIAGEI